MPGIKNVFGGASLRPGRGFDDSEELGQVYDILEKGDCHIIDTATLYGESEKILGDTGAPKRFTIDTKTVGGFKPGNATKENVLKDFENSREKLRVEQVDIWYIHAPDYEIPIEQTLEGVNEAYKKGFFKRFGLSNYKAEDVQKVYDVCKEKGYPLPTVYQGNYSAVARKQEEVLFPTLRKLGIAFYAYSPLAGGFLTKTKQDVEDGKGRFDRENPTGKMYRELYARPSYLEALARWEAIAKEEGVTRAELGYRWVKYNSPLKPENGDAIILGASSKKQLEETLAAVQSGPLSEKAVKSIDDLWEVIKHEAPLDNLHK